MGVLLCGRGACNIRSKRRDRNGSEGRDLRVLNTRVDHDEPRRDDVTASQRTSDLDVCPKNRDSPLNPNVSVPVALQ